MELERIRAGDREAFGLLLEETWAPLVLYLATFLEMREDAEDAAQEAFVRLWEHRRRWVSGSARAMLFRIGRNVALDLRRKAAVRRRWTGSRLLGEAKSPANPEEVLTGKELLASFREAVEGLPARRREVFELVRLRGLTHGEAAEVLDLSYRTVANHLRLAMRDVRHLLQENPLDGSAESTACGQPKTRNEDERWTG